MKCQKYKLLQRALLYDVIGMATMAIPVIGPFLDLIWAPISSKKMMEMYPGKKGKIMAIVSFLEEILPFTDIIPSFTIMWIYTFVWSSRTEAVVGY